MPNFLTDERRRAFLDALDERDDITPSDWEARFLESTIDQQSFSEKQADAIDRMIMKYDGRMRGTF